MTHDIPLASNSSRGTVHDAKPMRVLMVHWDGGGNMPPQRALARELKRRGHDIHVLTHNTLAETVIKDGGHSTRWTPCLSTTRPSHTRMMRKTRFFSITFAVRRRSPRIFSTPMMR